ncbi:MAG TPA: prepilin-type N-terminal cleavage/methylation domain-containing protein [Planctomycetota bacterium]|nr:prepilin-type N-terminal cleavage/methylation domain-containing protein [Planctomycetota bacterium]
MSTKRGFTLIELVVVLMVLIALAGILIPQFSGVVNRTHTAAASTNMTEINKAVAFYQVKTLKGYPDKLDVPLVTPGTAGLADTLEAGFDGVPVTLDANQTASLNAAGITTAYPLLSLAAIQSNGLSATFGGNDLAHPVDYTTGTPKAVQMTDLRAAQEFGNSLQGAAAGETYVIFGLNDSSTAVPTVMQSAPVHFDQVDPTAVYSRYFLVFAIPVHGATSTFTARYVGSVGSELSGLSGHLSGYYGKDSQ